MYYVYFARSSKNDKVYVGKTSENPSERIDEHNQGSNEWTKLNGPFTLIYYEKYFCKKDAGMRELFYKSGFGKKIKKLLVESLDS